MMDDEEERNSYSIRPSFKQKFPQKTAQGIIREILNKKLEGATYTADATSPLTKEISDEVKQALKELNLPRYKYLVQVVIGEQRGEGVRMGCRCFWDSNTDNYASETFVNDS